MNPIGVNEICETLQYEPAKPGSLERTGSNAPLVEALKETHRHMEELYRQAGEGRIVTDGLNAARERASALTQALIEVEHLNAAMSDCAGGKLKS